MWRICAWCKNRFETGAPRPRLTCSKRCQYQLIPRWRRDAYRGGWYRRRNGAYLHRSIVEELLGRPLKRGEVVAFKDGDRGNCDPNNLIHFPTRAAFNAWKSGRPEPTR